MKSVPWLGVVLISLFQGIPRAQAAPTAWPNGKWDLRGVINGTSSTLVSDSVDPKQVWVLPPVTGKVETPRLISTGTNIRECDKMFAIQDSSRKMTARIAELTLEAMRLEGDPDQQIQVLEKLYKQVDLFNQLYSKLAALEGGFAEMAFQTQWSKNVELLQSTNKNRFVFTPVPTHMARLFIGFAGGADRDSYLASLPAVLSYAVNGRTYMPYGDSSVAELPSLPEQLSASIRLSLVGACPLAYPEKFELSKDAIGVPRLSVAAAYEYPLLFHTNVKFTYNLYGFYERMKKVGTKGILAWKKAYSEIVEKSGGSDHFKVEWTQTDPDQIIPFEKRREVEKEIKADILARAARLMAVPRLDPSTEKFPDVPVSGAVALANGLQSACFGQSYLCSGASWALRGLDSVFGNNSAESRFRTSYNINVTEEWSDQSVRWKPAMVTFAEAVPSKL